MSQLEEKLDIEDNEVVIQRQSEMSQIMSNLDKDELDKETNMSSIDPNTRLSERQITDTAIFDEFQRLGIFPKEWGLTRQLKRLVISKNGEGRREKVEMIKGERENTSGSSGLKKLASIFRPTG